jgi:predicted  nucleic acid-binding Zn-ribbon protein
MSLNDWVISTSAGVIAILISLVAYFAQKWFEHIDDKLKEHSEDLKNNTGEIISLKQRQSSQTADISQAVSTKISEYRIPTIQLDRIEKEVASLHETIDKKMAPQIDSLQDKFGNVIVLEESIRGQEEKLKTLYNVVKLLVEKKIPGQK